jgi:small GTP-binding protein
LFNAIAGESLSIVDDAAGTTRDPVDSLLSFGGSTWRFIDTAGLKKRANQDSGTDYYASLRTATALERCEVAVVVLDASEPITEQDLRVITMVEEAGKAMVIVMNKWDLVDEDRRNKLIDTLIRLSGLNGSISLQRLDGIEIGWHLRFVPLWIVGNVEFQPLSSTHSLAHLLARHHHLFAVASSQRSTTQPKLVLLHLSLWSSPAVGSRPPTVASLNAASARSSNSLELQFR